MNFFYRFNLLVSQMNFLKKKYYFDVFTNEKHFLKYMQ
jgi:hypothetical protein